MTQPEIKISLDGNKWCALICADLHDGQAFFGDTPYEALEMALESLPDYQEACAGQSATIRFFEFEPDALDIRLGFYPALTKETKPSVVTKAVQVVMKALQEGRGDVEPSRIIVP